MTIDKSMSPQAKDEPYPAGFADTAEMRPVKKKSRFSKKSDLLPAIPALPKKETAPAAAPGSSSKTCPVCLQSFGSVHAFTLHIKTHNTEDRVCGICQKVLSSPSSRDRHMLTHSGERPFVCKVCNSNFTTNGNMHRHMKTHQDVLSTSDHTEDVDSSKDDTSNDVRSSSPEMTIVLDRVEEDTSGGRVGDTLPKVEATSTSSDSATVPIHHDSSPRNIQKSSDDDTQIYKCDGGPEKKRRIMGFDDLSVFEVSAPKFSLIATSINSSVSRSAWSESHDCVCEQCGNAFPCKSSLQYHRAKKNCPDCNCYFSTDKDKTDHLMKYHSSEDTVGKGHSNHSPKAAFMKRLGLVKRENTSPTSLHSTELRNSGRKPGFELPVSLSSSPDRNLPLEKADLNAPEIRTEKQNTNVPESRMVDNPVTTGNDFASIYSILNNVQAIKRDSSVTDNSSKETEENEVSIKDGSSTQKISKKYKCETCGYGSDDKSSLNRHKITHSEERPFTCMICSTTFTNRSNGERHARDKHKLKDRTEISKAVIRNSTSSTFPSEEFKCKYCQKSFESSQALQHHIRSQNDSCQQKPYQCSACGAFASTKNNISRHISKKHESLVACQTEKERKSKINALVVIHPTKSRNPQDNSEDAGSEHDPGNSEEPNVRIADWDASRSSDLPIAKIEIPEEEPATEPVLTVSPDSNPEPEENPLFPSPVESHPLSLHINGDADANEGMHRLADVCSEAPRLTLEEPLDLSVRAMDLSRSTIGEQTRVAFNHRTLQALRIVTLSETFSIQCRLERSMTAHGTGGHPTISASAGALDMRPAARKSRKQSKSQVTRSKPYNKEAGATTHKSFHSFSKHGYTESAMRKALKAKDLQTPGFSIKDQLRKMTVKTESVNPDEREVNSDLENLDLASVPSVINTANSSKISCLLNYGNAQPHTTSIFN